MSCRNKNGHDGEHVAVDTSAIKQEPKEQQGVIHSKLTEKENDLLEPLNSLDSAETSGARNDDISTSNNSSPLNHEGASKSMPTALPTETICEQKFKVCETKETFGEYTSTCDGPCESSTIQSTMVEEHNAHFVALEDNISYKEDDGYDKKKDEAQPQPQPIENYTRHSHSSRDQHATSALFFASHDSSTNNPGYKCFICNADLSNVKSGLKGRMNHIKRCGRRHGIQAGDGMIDMNMNINDDNNENGVNETEGNCGSNGNGWHDDADRDLVIDDVVDRNGLATSHCEDNTCIDTPLPQKQASLNSYFVRPVRSLDKVLLQGAKNAAKKEQIKAKQQTLGSTASSSTGLGRKNTGWKRKRDAPVRRKMSIHSFIDSLAQEKYFTFTLRHTLS